jgi:hypothetical protein
MLTRTGDDRSAGKPTEIVRDARVSQTPVPPLFGTRIPAVVPTPGAVVPTRMQRAEFAEASQR